MAEYKSVTIVGTLVKAPTGVGEQWSLQNFTRDDMPGTFYSVFLGVPHSLQKVFEMLDGRPVKIGGDADAPHAGWFAVQSVKAGDLDA